MQSIHEFDCGLLLLLGLAFMFAWKWSLCIDESRC